VPVLVLVAHVHRRQHAAERALRAGAPARRARARGHHARVRRERARHHVLDGEPLGERRARKQRRPERDREREGEPPHSFTYTTTSADSPARSVRSAGASSHSMRTGTRCTTLTKFPDALSAGKSEKLAPVPPERLATRP